MDGGSIPLARPKNKQQEDTMIRSTDDIRIISNELSIYLQHDMKRWGVLSDTERMGIIDQLIRTLERAEMIAKVPHG